MGPVLWVPLGVEIEALGALALFMGGSAILEKYAMATFCFSRGRVLALENLWLACEHTNCASKGYP